MLHFLLSASLRPSGTVLHHCQHIDNNLMQSIREATTIAIANNATIAAPLRDDGWCLPSRHFTSPFILHFLLFVSCAGGGAGGVFLPSWSAMQSSLSPVCGHLDSHSPLSTLLNNNGLVVRKETFPIYEWDCDLAVSSDWNASMQSSLIAGSGLYSRQWSVSHWSDDLTNLIHDDFTCHCTHLLATNW